MGYVVDYDEAIITHYDVLPDYKYSWQHFDTWDEAKDSLVDYWDRAVSTTKNKLKQVKRLKQCR